MKTRKFSISTTYGDSVSRTKEFLIPFTGRCRSGFRGVKSGRACQYGKIVHIGMDVGVDDVFAKLVDSGQKIENADEVLCAIDTFLKEIQKFRIGNIVSISYSDGGASFELVKEADRPPMNPKNRIRLP